jgi:hypothetical protein
VSAACSKTWAGGGFSAKKRQLEVFDDAVQGLRIGHESDNFHLTTSPLYFFSG